MDEFSACDQLGQRLVIAVEQGTVDVDLRQLTRLVHAGKITSFFVNEELLKIWQKTKKTVIFVTHSIEEATFLSDRVLVMSARPGRVKEMVEIDLPRPRGEATRNDPKFTEYNKYLRGIIG